MHADLVCPECHGTLTDPVDDRVRCTGCDRTYPMAGTVPVLLPVDSAFDAETIAKGRDTYYANKATENPRRARARKSLPSLGLAVDTVEADRLVNDLLEGLVAEAGTEQVSGLVTGAGLRVKEYAARFPTVSWLVTDVEATFGADVVGDLTALPVASGTQSFVLCEHVLEHVIDPLAAAKEIERVLRPGGIALVKVPFNRPWHGGYIDFYRLTPAGYLAAFRHLDVVHIGHGNGPAATVNHAIQAAWTSMFTSRNARRAAVGIGRVVLGPFRKLDRWLVRRPGSLNSTCSVIFVGRRVEHARTATEVIAQAKALGVAPLVGPAQRSRKAPAHS